MGRFFLSICFLVAGANHFLNSEFYLPMMPGYLPLHQELILLSGFLEMLFGILLLFESTLGIARFGLVALLIAVFPANIEMALHREHFPQYSPAILWLRLPLQAFIIWWVIVVTRLKKRGEHDRSF